MLKDKLVEITKTSELLSERYNNKESLIDLWNYLWKLWSGEKEQFNLILVYTKEKEYILIEINNGKKIYWQNPAVIGYRQWNDFFYDGQAIQVATAKKIIEIVNY